MSHRGGATFTDEQTEIFWRLFNDLIEANKRITREFVQKKIQEDERAKKEIVGLTPQQQVDSRFAQSEERLSELLIRKKQDVCDVDKIVKISI